LISSLQLALLLLPAERERGLPVAMERFAQAAAQLAGALPQARSERVVAAPAELEVALPARLARAAAAS
jgi:hypothetical protein